MIGAIDAQLLLSVLYLGSFFGAIWIAVKIADRFRRMWIIWPSVFVIWGSAVLLTAPVSNYLTPIACHGSVDYQACMDGDTD